MSGWCLVGSQAGCTVHVGMVPCPLSSRMYSSCRDGALYALKRDVQFMLLWCLVGSQVECIFHGGMAPPRLSCRMSDVLQEGWLAESAGSKTSSSFYWFVLAALVFYFRRHAACVRHFVTSALRYLDRSYCDNWESGLEASLPGKRLRGKNLLMSKSRLVGYNQLINVLTIARLMAILKNCGFKSTTKSSQ